MSNVPSKAPTGKPKSFELPGDGRQAAHLREKRRLLFLYLESGPKSFYKVVSTICQEMSEAWPDLSWSRRTVFRLLADLQKLGLVESVGRRGSQGARIRRINKGCKREDGTPTPSQGRRIHRKKTVDQREDGTPTKQSAKMALPQTEDGTPRGREDGTQGSSYTSYSKPAPEAQNLNNEGPLLSRLSSSSGFSPDPPKPTDDERARERKFLKQFRKLPTDTQVWAKRTILARATGTVRNRYAYLRASLPEFVENLSIRSGRLRNRANRSLPQQAIQGRRQGGRTMRCPRAR